jgi:hypothetical protein
MAKTWQNVLDESRVLLQDAAEPYRLEDDVLLAKLNRGLQELRRLRPDAFWDRFDTTDETTESADAPEIVETVSDSETELALTSDFNIDKIFYTPLVYWVTSSAELVEEEFVNDGRAIALQSQFKSMVVAL